MKTVSVMGIKITLPKGDDLITGAGTKVFNNKNQEISDITNIDINIDAKCFVTAKVDVYIESIEGMDNIHALLGTKTLQDIAELHGCIFQRKNDE